MHLFQYLVLLFVGLLSFLPLLARSNGSKLPMLPSNDSTKLLCTVCGQSFVENTEYFNKIIEGATVFGFHFLPSLTFLMAEDMGLNVGFIWEKHFGHMRPWDGIRPTLSIYYNHTQTTFIVGIFSLQDYPTTLLEPLCLPRRPFIEGLHFKLAKNRSYLSGWLNWLTLLSKKDQKPETFTLHVDGAWACYQPNSNDTVGCTIPFQLAVYHLGGQGIQVKDYSLWCLVGGLSLRFPNGVDGTIHGTSYLLLSRYIKTIDRPCKKGWGQLHTINWLMPCLGLSLSYWYGNDFSSENMGHPLYQSIRIEDDKVVHYEKIRNLFFVSIYKDWMLRSVVTIQAAFRPYYDFENRLLEYGFSCKLVYARKVQCATLQ